MLNRLRNLNRFLLGQSFYPLVLSSLLALVLFTGRWIYSRHGSLDTNLPFNLVLAWVPYFFSMAALGLYRLWPRQGWLLLFPAAIWLLFFPNAPYILTDFLHLQARPPVPLWFDVGMLITFAWTGCFLAITSLRAMHFLASHYLGRTLGWAFAIFTLALGALGIYLGRFPRWNSWDIFTQPGEILKEVAYQAYTGFSLLRFLGFTSMFTLFLFVLYLMFVSIRRFEDWQ